MYDFTACIVTYNTEQEELNRILNCFKKIKLKFKLWISDNSEKDILRNFIENFSDVILETYLRDKLEKDNKIIRETIVQKAINEPLDYRNFITLDTQNSDINFDKDIDEILSEIENDPDLKIDESEIEKILAEIEEESKDMKPKLSVNLNAIKKAKENFNK